MRKAYSKIDRGNINAPRIYVLTAQCRMIKTEEKLSKQEKTDEN